MALLKGMRVTVNHLIICGLLDKIVTVIIHAINCNLIAAIN